MTEPQLYTPVHNEHWGDGVVRVVDRSNGEVVSVRVGFGNELVWLDVEKVEVLDS